MLRDFLRFRYLVTPYLLEILFWLGLAVYFSNVIINFKFIMSDKHLWQEVLKLGSGLIGYRMLFEFIMVIFRIQKDLAEIKHTAQCSPEKQ